MKKSLGILALSVTLFVSTLAQAQYYGDPAYNTTPVYSPTSQSNERIETVKGYEFFLGAAFPLSDAYPKRDTHYAFGVGYAWGLNDSFIEARVDIMNRFASPAQYYSAFTLGGNYIFHNTEQIGLFAGGHFGLGFGESNDDSAGGFHFGADLGALFMRQADVNLDGRFRFMTNTMKHGDERPFIMLFMLGIHM